jgi:hypothetical protein
MYLLVIKSGAVSFIFLAGLCAQVLQECKERFAFTVKQYTHAHDPVVSSEKPTEFGLNTGTRDNQSVLLYRRFFFPVVAIEVCLVKWWDMLEHFSILMEPDGPDLQSRMPQTFKRLFGKRFVPLGTFPCPFFFKYSRGRTLQILQDFRFPSAW